MITSADISLLKSQTVTDTGGNGGRVGTARVVTGTRQGVFPRVTRAERTAGLTRRRKFFLRNDNGANDTAYDALLHLLAPSPGGDRHAVALGLARDTQADVQAAADIPWMGVGALSTPLAGGETQVVLNMGGTDVAFPNGGFLHLVSHFLVGQTAAATVSAGDSVTLDAGTWKRIAATTDVTHPKGIWIGGGLVYTQHAAGRAEYLRIAARLRENEQIGTGNGASLAPAMSALAQASAGVSPWRGLLPVVSTVCGGVARTVAVGPDGVCTGYCGAGQLDMLSGAWTTPISWTTPPDAGAAIRITYRERPFTRVGNVYTVYLDEQVAGAYATASTFGAGCAHQGELVQGFDGVVLVSAAGSYNHGAHPVQVPALGSVEDTWTITFSGPAAFTCAGLFSGPVGTGTLGANFSPTNPATGTPYFTLLAAGWAGSFQAGETLTFQTHPAVMAVWIRQTVPAGLPAGESLPLVAWQVDG